MVTMRKDKKFSSFKHPIPNIFQGTAFKKHTKLLIEKKGTAGSSNLFFVLFSTTSRKEKINNFFNNVHLHPIDCVYEDFSDYSLMRKTFYLQHLDSRLTEEREAAKEIVFSNFKHMAEFSNSNLI